jgi:hypothetical protein
MFYFDKNLVAAILFLVSAAEKKQREESSHPVFIVKLRYLPCTNYFKYTAFTLIPFF